MSDSLKNEILQHFDGRWLTFYERYGAKEFRKDGGQWACCCPLHGENQASFKVSSEGKWYCHGEKVGGDGFAYYARRHNLSVEGDFPEILKRIAEDFGINGRPSKKGTPPPWERPVGATYSYQDEQGQVVAYVLRFSDGLDPKFMQGRPKDEGGIRWRLDGLQMPLYHLPAVLKASEVIVVEGEKDADNTRKLGFTATTCAQGAGKWRREHAECLRGKHVILCGDNDEPGRKHMREVGASLVGVAASIKVLELPDLPPKGDISDWITRFKDAEEAGERLAVMIESAPAFQIEGAHGAPVPLTPADTCIIQFVQNEPPPREYLLDELLPRREVGGIAGMGGVSKSFLFLTLGLGVAAGQTVLDRFTPAKAFRVLALFAEDPTDELHRRIYYTTRSIFPDLSPDLLELIRQNFFAKSVLGEENALMMLDGENPIRTGRYEWLKRSVENHQPDLLMIDPKSQFYGLDENSNTHSTAWVNALGSFVQEYGMNVLFSTHVSQSMRDELHQMSARGGTALADGCRWMANLRVMQEADAKRFLIDNRKDYVEFDVSKNNYVRSFPKTIFFKRGPEGVLEPVNLGFDRLKVIAEESCSAIVEHYRTRADLFTIRDIVSGPKGVEVRRGIDAALGSKTSREERGNALDYALKEDMMRLVQDSRNRQRQVLCVGDMMATKPEKVIG